jgi:hypothetical protein
MDCGGLPPLFSVHRAPIACTSRIGDNAMDKMDKIVYREWTHAPSHLFSPGAVYMVTAGTY